MISKESIGVACTITHKNVINAVISTFTEFVNWYFSDLQYTFLFSITFEVLQNALPSYKIISTFCLKALRTARILVVDSCLIIMRSINVLMCTDNLSFVLVKCTEMDLDFFKATQQVECIPNLPLLV